MTPDVPHTEPVPRISASLGAEAAAARAAAHQARLQPILDERQQRRQQYGTDPVLDFLFEYYKFRPSKLLRWSPGVGVALAGGAVADEWRGHPAFAETADGLVADPARFPAHRRTALAWMRDLLAATASRKPFFGCHGLHEWAMVYRTDAVRHSSVPLRMAPDALARFVESRNVVCSHFDAFRFFTPAARPLNHHQPTHALMTTLEQPGCLHANMDLYRWAYKLSPWTPSDLVADTFLLACQIRTIDMRASPYDLRAYGLAPIPIETPEGRRVYQQHQRHFAQAAAPLRERLLRVLTMLGA